jgi:hypothetical protein
MGHAPVKVLVPLVLLGIAGASWALRPASRVLGAAPAAPATAGIGAHEIAKAGA